MALGVGAALALDAGVESWRFPPAVVARASSAAAGPGPTTGGDGAALEAIVRLRQEAEALTATEVLLDERAFDRWIPLIPALEAQRARAGTSRRSRRELTALLHHLAAIGLPSRVSRAAPIPPIHASVSN